MAEAGLEHEASAVGKMAPRQMNACSLQAQRSQECLTGGTLPIAHTPPCSHRLPSATGGPGGHHSNRRPHAVGVLPHRHQRPAEQVAPWETCARARLRLRGSAEGDRYPGRRRNAAKHHTAALSRKLRLMELQAPTARFDVTEDSLSRAPAVHHCRWSAIGLVSRGPGRRANERMMRGFQAHSTAIQPSSSLGPRFVMRSWSVAAAMRECRAAKPRRGSA